MPMTVRTSLRRSVKPSARNSFAALRRVRNESRRASSTPMRAAETRMPRPPSWVITRIRSWPRNVQCVAVSTDASPVVVTADAAVKNASTGVVVRPGADMPGRSSSTVPAAIAPVKPITTTCAGCRRNRRRRPSVGLSLTGLRVATGTPYARARMFGSMTGPSGMGREEIGCARCSRWD